MGDFLGKGYSVFADNFYNSVKLAKHLSKQKTYIFRDCKGNPKDIVKKKLKKGKENLCGSGRINATSWPFLTKSQCWVNDPSTQTNVGSSTKPNIVCDYNNGMSRVDQSDQMLSYYQGLRSVFNGSYVYKKIRVHFLDLLNKATMSWKLQNLAL